MATVTVTDTAGAGEGMDTVEGRRRYLKKLLERYFPAEAVWSQDYLEKDRFDD
jgi:hypothetical protein